MCGGVVMAKGPEGDVLVKAAKGVVLSCGGYEFNNKLKLFLPAAPVYFYGNPGNTGDGVLMAQAVGAQLWNMNKVVGRGIAYFDGLGFHHRHRPGALRHRRPERQALHERGP